MGVGDSSAIGAGARWTVIRKNAVVRHNRRDRFIELLA
jgi:hypothetical protein